MKLILAPMASITDLPYRLLMKRHFGVDVVISELISSHGLCFQDRKTLQLAAYHPDERPVGGQIFGQDSDLMATAAKTIESLGYDFVDVNLGCPVQKVVKKGAGAGMCRDVDNLFKVLSQIKSILCIPLTIKIRLGWDDDHINAEEIVDCARSLGIQWVAIHGRTRKQGYRGEVNWTLMRELAWKYPNFVVGNGDIRSYENYSQFVQDAPFLGVMIGRAVLSHPWIFEEIRNKQKVHVQIDWLLQLISTYMDYLQQHCPRESSIMLRMKKMASWMSQGLTNASKFRREVFGIKTGQASDVVDCAKRFFESLKPHALAERPIEAIYYGGEG